MQTIRQTLYTAALRHDEKNTKRRDYNRHALRLYMERIDDCCKEIANGQNVEQALRDNFNDRLLTVFLKALNLPTK